MGLKGGFVNCSHCFKDMGIQLRELPRSPVVKNPPANAEDLGSIPGLGRYPEGENGNPLQYSCLGNPMDRGACQAYSPTLCLIAESCPTPCDPMDYTVHEILGQNTEVGSHSLLQGIFPTQGWNPGLPHCRRILYQLSHHGSNYTSIQQILYTSYTYIPTYTVGGNANLCSHYGGQYGGSLRN